MIALGIDTSCYTTSIAFARSGGAFEGRRQLLPVQRGERGLRQSEAVFAHMKQLPPLLEELLRLTDEPIGAVCVSASPVDGDASYMPVFSVGLGAARSLSAALRVPLFKTTHQRGHLRAARVDSGLRSDRYLALHLSGGTTDVLHVAGDVLTPLAGSEDLHAGQLVDRVGVRLGLPFPAGPELERLAAGHRDRALVPVSMDGLSCHLSGAEAALMRLIDEERLSGGEIAAEVYSVLCRSVLRLLCAAVDATGEKNVLLAGGVISSARLRQMLTERNEKRRLGLSLHFGRPELSGDNAVGVALLGAERMTGAWQ